MPQLGLLFDQDVIQTWTDAADGAPDLTFSVALTRTGTRLRLTGPWPRPEDAGQPERGVLWQAEVDVVGQVRALVSPPPEGRAMAFASDLPLDCFTAPLAWAAWATRKVGWAAEISRWLLAIRRSLVLVARHLEGLMAGPALTACRPFPQVDGMRWFVYQAATRGDRIARLATCCPGILMLCKVLSDRGAEASSRRILDAAATGISPGRVLDLALQAWAETRTGSPDPATVARQRIRVTRAGPQLPPEVLWQLPPASDAHAAAV